MNAMVLRLDVTGRPIGWLSKPATAILYVREQIAWEAGERSFRLHGGRSRLTGLQSFLDLNSIVATAGVARIGSWDDSAPILTNSALFRRDGFLCLYCGGKLPASRLTRDHVLPRSRGGLDAWENVVTACQACNVRKDNMTLREAERAGMRLLAVPYRPNLAEGLILQNRTILADQMGFLKTRLGKGSRFTA